MKTCSHCGHEVAADAKICPNCGTDTNTVLPLVASERLPEAAPPKRDGAQVGNGMGTGCLLSAAAYFFLAVTVIMYGETRVDPGWRPNPFFQYGTWTINLVPLTVIGGLYFLLRPRFPSFARGLGYCLLVIGVLLLWGLAACRQ